MHASADEALILDAWQSNAQAWEQAVREGRIESRKLVTDQAIVDAVLACAPRTVIDVGCGEGWLARALAVAGVKVIGVDVIPALIESARANGDGDFRILSYEDMAAGALPERADVVVCNFSLLGRESVDGLLAAMPELFEPGGTLIVQTLHPLLAAEPYADGWREGSWVGCGSGFGQAAPWYFRTLGSWVSAFERAGLSLHGINEPIHPHTGRPASVIFMAGVGQGNGDEQASRRSISRHRT
ncbi:MULTISPECIES: class I SAM-dependent methyltransferase [unclassified Dyella]|uniref:class I SAM-dependent methyltransferase n=1 Tax=unclassified Dyella TaxID=2634549 RepID=UPI000C81C233|nr:MULTISPECIES: class I SAM-dependent methyltransferase [unclassified Dyella]MDR3445472.1 class I SAM-dependent methyltransferase [Dyella sp.]PMQ05302.1 Ubiquinone biosynthesis O-methyltransferase [Dyella sp. AD56]